MHNNSPLTTNSNAVHATWTTADLEDQHLTFASLEDAILTFRKLRKARGSKKVISNLLYKISTDSDWISTR